AYLAPNGWVALRLDVGEVDWDEVSELVACSYRLVAPKRLAALGKGATRRRVALDAAPEERPRSPHRLYQPDEGRGNQPRFLAGRAVARAGLDERGMRRGDRLLVRDAGLSAAARSESGGEHGVTAHFGTAEHAH